MDYFSKKTVSIGIIFLMLTLPKLSAQNNSLIELGHLSLKEGLSQSSVYSIYKDKRGFLWFGTQDGLNRYDGYGFAVYKKDPTVTSSLSNNFIHSLTEDTQYMWIGTDNGLNRYDPAQETFQSFLPQNGDKGSLNNKKINALLVSKDKKTLWIGTPSGLQTLDLENKKPTATSFTKVALQAGEIEVNRLFEDKQGNIWVGHAAGLEKYNQDADRFEKFLYKSSEKDSLENLSVTAIYQDKQDNLWIGAGQYLFSLENPPKKQKFRDLKADTIENANISSLTISDINQDKTGVYWIGTNEGLFKVKFFGETAEVTHIIRDVRNPDGLTANEIFKIYVDDTDIIWLGTYTGGINKYDLRNRNFKHYFRNSQDPKSLSSNNIRTFCADTDEGKFWVGTYGGGLNLFDEKTGTFEVFRNNPKDPNSVSDNDIQVVYKDRNNNIWIGTKNGGLNRYNRQNKTFIRYPYLTDVSKPSPDALIDPFVRVIFEDKRGNLWVGTRGGGLSNLNKQTGKFEHFLHDKNNPKSISSNTVYSMIEDSEGVLWVGTRDAGLNRFEYEDAQNYSFKSYQHSDKDITSLSHNNVISLFEDSKQRLWIGTYGGALNLFDREKETFTTYNEKDGLMNDVAYGILEDGSGKLWISTNKGIAQFTPKLLKQEKKFFEDGFDHQEPAFKTFDVFDGLQSNEFNGGAYFESEAGEMFFGGINGFSVFNPNNIKNNTTLPPVVITDFQIFNISQKAGGEVLEKNIQETSTIHLEYTQSVFSFEFVALNYTRPEKNEYAYRLVGFDKSKWTRTSRRFVTYTNLYPRTYIFEVRASNNDGAWNDKKTSITIIIKPPFWLTWWFWILVAVLVLGSTFAVYKWRIRLIKKREEVLEREVILQTAQIHQQKEEIQATLDNLQETQTQLLESDKMASLGQLTAGIAHEINNPINFVYAGINSLKANINDVLEVLDAYAEVTPENVEEQLQEVNNLKEDIEYEEVIEEMQELADSIKRGAERTAEIVNGLRTFSRLDEDDLKTADVHENLDATLSILRNQYKDHIEIIKEYGDIPSIDCYPGKLNQVFMNIIANAVQAMPDKGTITLSTRKTKLQEGSYEREGVIISIKDSGAGMPEAVKKRIFEPFFTTKEVGKGTGLGLSITHSIMEKHQGRIEVESEMGKGTEFKLILPVHPSKGELKEKT